MILQNSLLKKIFYLFYLLFVFQYSYSQVTYLVNYYPDAGNPGGINSEADWSTSGWTDALLPTSLSNNAWSPPISIPFSFQFFGQTVTSFRVSANGILTFSQNPPSPPNNNTALPSPILPDSSIAVFWDVFTQMPPTGTNDRVYYKVFGSAPNRQLWIKWYSFEYGEPTTANPSTYAYFACVLEETTNKIYIVDYNYHFPASGFTTTVGVQLDNSTAVQFGSSIDFGAGGSGYTDNDYYEFTPYTIFPYNGRLLDILQPVTNSCYSPNPVVRIHNLGSNSISGFTVAYRVDGGAPVNEVYTGTILPGDTGTYMFSTPLPPLSLGSHTLDAWIIVPSDGDNSNDSILNYNFDTKAILTQDTVTFEGGPFVSIDSFYMEMGPKANLDIINGVGNGGYALRFRGSTSGTSGWITPSGGNEWTINEDFSAKAHFCIDASSLSGLILKFDLRQTFYSTAYSQSSNFRVLVNGIQISPTFNPATQSSDPYMTYEYNLSSFVGGPITVTFESRNRYGSVSPYDAAYLDNVRFFEPAPYDAEKLALLSPSATLCGLGPVNVIYQFTNKGTNPISSITLSYQLDASVPVAEPVTISPALAPGDTFTYTFTTPLSFPSYGNHTLKVWHTLASDPYPQNDTLTAIISPKVNHLNDTVNFESYVPFTNETVLDSFYTEIGSKANVLIASNAAYSSNWGLRMEGSNGSGFITPSGGNEWTINEDFSAKAHFCVDATSLPPGTPFELRFDLKQTYTFNPAYSNFRVLVNGTQVTPTYRPSTSSSDPFQRINIDLSAYSGQSFTITFETRNKYNQASSSPGDNAFLDNIHFYVPPPNDLTVVELISPINYSCGDSNQVFQVVIRNVGRNPQSNFPVVVEVNGTQISGTSSTTYASTLNPGQVDTVLVGPINTAPGDTATITIYTDLFNDDNRSNDTLLFLYYFFPLPTPPSLTDTTVCGPEKVLFNFSYDTVNTYLWYDSLTGGNLIHTGNVFLTPTLTSSVTYYLQLNDVKSYHVGAPDISIGGGGYYSAFTNTGLIFDAYAPFILDSVKIFPSGTGSVTINLKDASSNILASITHTIPSPVYDTVLYVGFWIDPGTNYRLTADGTSGLQLYRNYSGATFPYSIPGLMAITDGTLSGYYYFFYDWVVRKPTCPTPRIPITVNVIPTPQVYLGSDTVDCSGNVLLNAGNPGASYLWNTGDTTQTITVSSSGTYWVTVTNQGICSRSDTIHVDIVSQPQVYIPDTTVCGGITLDATNPYSTYIWSTGVGTPTLTVTSSDTIWVTVTNICGASASDTGIIQIIPGPFFSLGPDTNLCDGQNATLSAPYNPSYLYSWNTGDTTSSIQVSTTGTYFVTVTNPQNGCTSSDTINVTFHPYPQVDLGNDTMTCGILVLDAGNPGSSYLWNTGQTTQTITVSQTGFYSVTVTNSGGCASTDSIFVLVNPTFSIDLGPDTLVCDPIYQLSVNYSPASYLWSTGDTTQSIFVTSDGYYWVRVTDPNGCVQTDTVYIRVAPLLTEPFTTPSVRACDSLFLNAQNNLCSYLWNTGDTTQSILVKQNGTYWVRIISPCGDTLYDTVQVTLDPSPTIPIGLEEKGCDTLILDAGNPGSLYWWSHGYTTQQAPFTQIGLYSVTVTTLQGCSTSHSFFVEVFPTPQADFVLPDTYLVNQYITVFPQATPYAQTFYWDFGPDALPSQYASGSGQKLFYYPDTGVKTVTLIAANGTCADTVTKTIVIVIPDTSNVGVDPTISSKMMISIYPNPASQYLDVNFMNLSTSQVINVAIYDLKGEHAFQMEHFNISPSHPYFRIPVSTLAKGTYLLMIQFGRQQIPIRFMKE